MNPKDCPRFPTCNANICPLDADWRKRSHVPGEEACQVVMEHVKEGADARFASRQVMTEIRPYASALLASLRVEKAERGESLMGRGSLLNQFEISAENGSTWAANDAAAARLRVINAAKKSPS
jgi:hypothetical protein